MCLKSLLHFVFPIPAGNDFRRAMLPRLPLFLKGLAVGLLQLLAVWVVVGLVLFLAAPQAFAVFSVLFESLPMLLFVALAIPVALALEVATAAILLQWYYRGIRTVRPFTIHGEAVESMPFKVAASIAWSCSWRIWFIKFAFFGVIGLLLVVADAFSAFDARPALTSNLFAKGFLQYSFVYAMIGIFLFLPFIRHINPAYDFPLPPSK